jgi:hypothetical protein
MAIFCSSRMPASSEEASACRSAGRSASLRRAASTGREIGFDLRGQRLENGGDVRRYRRRACAGTAVPETTQ